MSPARAPYRQYIIWKNLYGNCASTAVPSGDGSRRTKRLQCYDDLVKFIRLWQRRFELLSVVGLTAAVGNGVALGLMLRSRWFMEFFGSWELPVTFLSVGVACGGLCLGMSYLTEGIYRGLAIAGIWVAIVASGVLVVLIIVALLILLIGWVLGTERVQRKILTQMNRAMRGRRRRGF